MTTWIDAVTSFGEHLPQQVCGQYRIGWEGVDRVVFPADDAYTSYRPLDRRTLPEELAKLHEADERAVLSFVHINGLLATSPGYSEPLAYLWREARLVRLVLSLVRALQDSGGQDHDRDLEQTLESLIGPQTYMQLQRPPVVWPHAKPTWRESPDANGPGPRDYIHWLVESEVRSRLSTRLAGQPDFEETVSRETAQLMVPGEEIRRFGFTLEFGGIPPGILWEGDQASPGALARFVIRDILHSGRPGPREGLLQVGQIRRRLSIRESTFVVETTVSPLINAIYWMLFDVAQGARAVHLCPECNNLFVAHDPRQRFCSAPSGLHVRDSLCGNRHRTRRSRQKGTK